MSITIIVRDYLDQIRPIVYQTKELTEQQDISSWSEFLQSFFIFFESTFPKRIVHFFSFQWRIDIIRFPIIRPEIQMARTNSGIFSTIPLFPRDPFPRNLNFLVFPDRTFPTTIFQRGFLNAFFLACPRNLAFLVSIRRYWLQSSLAGLSSIIGYRVGETSLLLRIANGFKSIWWNTGSTRPLRIGYLVTIFLLWEAFSPGNARFWKPVVFEKQSVVSLIWTQINSPNPIKQLFRGLLNYKHIFRIFFLHWFYAWTEQRTFFSTFRNITFDTQSSISSLSYFTQGNLVSFSYRSGLFLGGLFFDICFRTRTLIIVERVLLRSRCPPPEWKQEIHKWTRRLIVAFSFRGIPFYSADYLVFSSFGFFGRDIELRRRVTRHAFNYSITPSFLLEGRYVIGDDSYGRAAPDIVREPWIISRVAIEANRDLVDETYRTQQSNQRVDRVYLGVLERKVFEWLTVRSAKNSTFSNRNRTPTDYSRKKSQSRRNQNKRLEQKTTILVGEPIRKIFNSDIKPNNIYSDVQINERQRRTFERILNRFDRWFRVPRQTKNREDFFGLPFNNLVPESLVALSTSHFRQQSFLASIGILEPQRAIRYASQIEFSRKRNARRSPLHQGPILRYIDLFLKTRSPIKNFSRDLSTIQQQRHLYRACIVLNDYITTARKYSEMEHSFLNNQRNSSSISKLIQRARVQRELYLSLFGGRRNRVNSVYSQQYVGNLQLIRRLFAVSWSNHKNTVPYHMQVNEKTFLRRKITLDQKIFDPQKNVFEHEELGKSLPLKIQNGKEREKISRFLPSSPLKHGINLGNWVLISKKRYFPDIRVEMKPLYAGWDSQRHALILCNRFLPSELAVRTKLVNLDEMNGRTNSRSLKNFVSYQRPTTRREFTVWPNNIKGRRIRLRNVRYNSRALLQNRTVGNNNSVAIDLSLLSQDRSFWRQKASSGDAAIFAFWLNPRSDAQRERDRGVRTNTPTRSSQSFPLSLERRMPGYVPGDLYPSIRGGLVWPGTNPFLFIPKSYYRPRPDQKFT